MKHRILLTALLIGILQTITAQKPQLIKSAKVWTMKVSSEYPTETKSFYDGKKVSQGENKINISNNSYLNITVNNGKIIDAILIMENSGITITADLMIARQRNQQGANGGDMCDNLLTLCQMQCSIGGGSARDPMHPGTCNEQCDRKRKACIPFGPLPLGGITLY